MSSQEEIADLIALKRNSFAAFSLGVAITTESMFSHFKSLFTVDLHTVVLPSKLQPGITIEVAGTLGRSFGGYQLNILDSLRFLDQNNSNRYDFLLTITAGVVLSIGDAIKKHDYFVKSPELEFLRHLRNGVAHGNQFDIRMVPGKSWRTATFSGLEILPTMNGNTVLNGFLHVGDVMLLLDFIEAELRKGAYG